MSFAGRGFANYGRLAHIDRLVRDAEERRSMPHILRKLKNKWRFGRKRASVATTREVRAAALRVSPETLERLGGDRWCSMRFGLEKTTIRRVWTEIQAKFVEGLEVDASSTLCGLTPGEVFLLLLQHLYQDLTLCGLSLQWGVSHTSIGQLLNWAHPALRASITSTHQWPPSGDVAASVGNRILQRFVAGAIDCRFQVRNRVHPGQALFYRGDQGKHGLSVQLLCSPKGT